MNEEYFGEGPTDINLNEYLPVWKSGEVECEMCCYQWLTCYHMDSEKLECPNCGEMAYFIEV